MTPAQQKEYDYRVEERYGIFGLLKGMEPTQEQWEIADREAREAIKEMKEQQ